MAKKKLETVIQKLMKDCRSQTVEAIIRADNGNLIKECNKAFFDKNKTVFDKMSTEIVTNFEISRRDYQNVLRNTIGKTMQETIGFNPYVPKAMMEKGLHGITKMLKAELGFSCAQWNNVVVGYTNVRKNLEWLLKRKSLNDQVNVSTGKILIFFYVDLFPWLQWSRFFTGETTIRIKILDEKNSFNSVITVASWLGSDKSEYVKHLGCNTFNQLMELDTITHPSSNDPIKVSFCLSDFFRPLKRNT